MKYDILTVTRYAQNCSLLACEQTGAAAVIDPGGDIGLLLDWLEWQELRLETILVTHGHFDHCGAAADLAERTGARIEGPHIGDAAAVAGLAEAGEKFGLKARPYTPARWLEHGDVIAFGAQALEVLHCPGHCPGHVAYFHRAARQAFVGDILFRGAIGAWEHPGGSLPLLLDSIRNRLFPLGDDVRFVPGHGDESTFGRERVHNPFVGEEAMARWRERRAMPAPPADPAA
ncbi:MAG: MBL fold metallo-hydrolase [Sphingomonadales bacterium]|nr:MBL fold metallo-hydrolase [Sphingomonadales bacterium]